MVVWYNIYRHTNIWYIQIYIWYGISAYTTHMVRLVTGALFFSNSLEFTGRSCMYDLLLDQILMHIVTVSVHAHCTHCTHCTHYITIHCCSFCMQSALQSRDARPCILCFLLWVELHCSQYNALPFIDPLPTVPTVPNTLHYNSLMLYLFPLFPLFPVHCITIH